jgi:HPt (histidine-containing phosphotransfer) domain-containing protein
MSTSTYPSHTALNFPELLSRVDNDRELLCELLRLFKDECPPLVLALREAISRDDMTGVTVAGHTLKGMLANLAAKGATAAAARLEEIGRTGVKLGLTDCFTSLESELDLLTTELDAYLNAQS